MIIDHTEAEVEPSSGHRVLIVHNSYQYHGGEDAVVASESALLRQYGHAVAEYRRSHEAILGTRRASLAMQAIWSTRTARDIREVISVFRPDVIHAHNTFPLVSGSLYWAAARARVPVVQTLHNFRLLCLQGALLRQGIPCEDCIGHAPWRGVVHRCYHQSVLASAALAGSLTFHRGVGTYANKIARYVALSEFSKSKFVAAGLPQDRIVVKPNFAAVPVGAPQVRHGGLYVGRLASEKGIDLLLDVLERTPGTSIRVVGDGPLAERVAAHPGVIFRGRRTQAEVLSEMQTASYLVMPSRCYENFPVTLAEAFASRLPVIASDQGALAELIDDGKTGLLFEPGSVLDLKHRLVWAENHPAQLLAMGEEARRVFEARYSPAANHRQLTEIYRAAIEQLSTGRSPTHAA